MKYQDKSIKIYTYMWICQIWRKKDLTEVKMFQKVLGGYFFETPCSLPVFTV